MGQAGYFLFIIIAKPPPLAIFKAILFPEPTIILEMMTFPGFVSPSEANGFYLFREGRKIQYKNQ